MSHPVLCATVEERKDESSWEVGNADSVVHCTRGLRVPTQGVYVVKTIFRVLSVVILIYAPFVLSGCGEERVTQPQPENRQHVETPVLYTGGETVEDVRQSIAEIRKMSPEAASFFTEELERQMVRAFLDARVVQPRTLGTQSWYSAYASHYVWSGHDKDLWLEYKWWTGGTRQGYHFETPIWALYWAVRVCYGGAITSWTWMEGNYQRVTGVVGSCVYVPFGDGFIRSYLRVVA